MMLLTFQFGNAKLTETIATFSLPSGWTCSCANECLSKANRETGRITDGPKTKFRCFSASQESGPFTSVRISRWRNYDLLREHKTTLAMTDLICASLPKTATKVRVHVAGDFFNEAYFKAWLNVAYRKPSVIFYGYTKRIKLLLKHRANFPANFRFVASIGGKEDSLIIPNGLKYARVVFTEQEAVKLGLELDHEDDHAYSLDNKPFALLLHGMQPKNTPAAEAWKTIRLEGKGYGKVRLAERNPKLKIDLTFFTKRVIPA